MRIEFIRTGVLTFFFPGPLHLIGEGTALVGGYLRQLPDRVLTNIASRTKRFTAQLANKIITYLKRSSSCRVLVQRNICILDLSVTRRFTAQLANKIITYLKRPSGSGALVQRNLHHNDLNVADMRVHGKEGEPEQKARKPKAVAGAMTIENIIHSCRG